MQIPDWIKRGAVSAAAATLLACTSNGPGTGAGSATGSECTAPITLGATVTTSKTGLCLACSVTDPNNVIDDDPDNYASINLDLSLLTGSAGLAVHGPSGVTYPAGLIPGFTVFVPDAALLAASVLPQVTISTSLSGAEQESSRFTTLLTLDLLGLLRHNARFYVGIKATKPFDTVSISAEPLVASALDILDVVNGCSDASSVGALPPQ